MEHNVTVEVTNKPNKDAVVSCKKVPIGLKLFNKLFGDKEKMTVIILGKSVANITIKETERN